MFGNCIDLIPPFNKEIKNKIITNDFEPYNGDESLFMTLTCLFYKRWPNFHIVSKNCEYNRASCSTIKENEGSLSFYWFNNTKTNPNEQIPEGYIELTKHEKWLTSVFGQTIYFRKYGNTTIAVFCERMSLCLYHAIQVFVSVYFDKFFEENEKTEEETELLLSLSKDSSTAYMKAIQTMLQKEDLKTYLLKTQMVGFEKTLRERKYRAAENIVSGLMRDMENKLAEYRVLCTKKNDAVVVAEGLRYEMDEVSENTEFEEYLCQNKLLSNISLDGNHLKFIVKTFVSPYLPDDWNTLSRKGYIFNGHRFGDSCFKNSDDLKLLLDAIFSRDHTLKLKMCAYFDINYDGSSVTSVREYDFAGADPNLKAYIPNPHLHFHNCFGQNASDILMNLESGDMIGAVECCINVTKRISVAENATFGPFIDSLIANKSKCIVDENGKEMNCKEALAYLKGKMNDEATPDKSGETDVA